MTAADRVRAYLDYLLTYPAGVPVIRKVYGYPLRTFEVRWLLGGAEVDKLGIGLSAATSVEEFLAAFSRTGEEVIDVRPREDDPQHSLTATDLAEVLAAARDWQTKHLLDAPNDGDDDARATARERLLELILAGLTSQRLRTQLTDAERVIRGARAKTGDYVATGGTAHEVIQADRILRGLPAYAG